MPIPSKRRLFALVPGAGVGERMQAPLPKQYLSLQGRTLAEHAVSRLLALPRVDTVMVVIAAQDPWWPALPLAGKARIRTTVGADRRAGSVKKGLRALLDNGADAGDWVLVHDMARPCVRVTDIEKLIEQCGEQGAILAQPVSDTLKRAAGNRIAETVPRAALWRAQTPQLFPLGALHDAIEKALTDGVDVTDEASAMEHTGWQPHLVAGSADNIKVTQAGDLALAEFILERQKVLDARS